MKKYAERLKSEQGFTLIEMIAALTLFSMIVGIISMVTMFGFRSYHKITIENSLRDEADIIMSTIINELYTFAPERVENTTLTNGITLKKGSTTDEVITFSQGSLVIGAITDEPDPDDPRTAIHSTLTGSVISSTSADGRTCQATFPCESGLIKIKLKLAQEYDGRTYTMELESKFGF
ncbi:PulJ/GspJ family protein [Paenibacillus wynnii]|uniref:PulJ/GspJ family protein n=1 Tax=Paenibacillus wynnii TaxID=268407 RepID=UPI00278D939F|nr:prepilin-type N-terminal cleavage/methylation domain-containing protein [Paenibacillus wynnii]MDQ0192159.1 prepilin-type N-terminal cleavage/methylation domain-containing protein [Paenibacillus wynnii]